MKKQLLFLLTSVFLCQILTAQTATGLDFDGQVASWDYVEIPDNNSLDFTTSFTFEAWVNFDQVNRTTDGWDWECIFAKSRYNESYGLMLLTDGGNKIFRFYHSGFGGNFTDYIWNSVTTNQWYHIAVTLSSTEVKFYIDGINVRTQAGSGSLTPNSNPLRIGAGATAGGDPYPLQGMMDEVRLWNYARTEVEINASMDCQLIGDETGLILNFDLNQGTVNTDNTTITTVTDKSSNNLDGNLVGFELMSVEGNFRDTSANGVSGSCDTLSVNESDFTENNIALVPNPTTNGAFRIEHSGNSKIEKVSIYNISGKLIKEDTNIVEGLRFDISEFASGLYLIEVKYAEGTLTKKLIKD
ncbi:LamG-like jellyroll fold domain-containing protein [Psychroserpens luteolus]|uniref:LamG-like jellyroll fold domain-containing protein n=1 Tax=Psychroserpens luteolus TaxID=2855840 RepID=UPI001E4835BA|nr:LamG-like jellyroll fold domain-containing protein [Psychroserpens luteolus]MCD2258389.1 T9SS type A sorting domain-containing protein [Psychroserpens luteolus]